MERLQLTSTQQAFVDTSRTELSIQPNDVVQEGTNLVVDDHLQVDNSWFVVVIGGASGCVASYMPTWGDFWIPIDLVNYVTDRAGPNGETMPIFDEQLQARRAKAGDEGLRDATKTERREERAHRRDIREMLRDGLRRLPQEQRKRARDAMRAQGVLGKDDKDDD